MPKKKNCPVGKVKICGKCINKKWKKESKYRKTIWKRGGFGVTMRLNPVIRKYQVYSTDGSMEVKDYGTFGLRSEDLADETVKRAIKDMNKYIKKSCR